MQNQCDEIMSVEKVVSQNLKPYEWAKRERLLNIKEVAGKEHNPRIVKYHSFTTLRATDDETAWCSAFMCAAAELNGFKSTRSAAAKSWETYGVEVKLEDAQIGDILIFNRKSNQNPNARHVTFLDAKIKEGDKFVQCLGGNQGNMVCVAKYKLDDLIAIRRFPV